MKAETVCRNCANYDRDGCWCNYHETDKDSDDNCINFEEYSGLRY